MNKHFLNGVKVSFERLSAACQGKITLDSLTLNGIIPQLDKLEWRDKVPYFRNITDASLWLDHLQKLSSTYIEQYSISELFDLNNWTKNDLKVNSNSEVTPSSIVMDDNIKLGIISDKFLSVVKKMGVTLLKQVPDNLRINVRMSGYLFTALVISWLVFKLPVIDFAGAYYPRVKRGNKSLSVHSFGMAVDINPSMGNNWLQKVDEKCSNLVFAGIYIIVGFCWGGLWKSTPDAMHFELAKVIAD